MRMRSWLLLIAGLLLLPSAARAQPLLMAPVACAQDCQPSSMFALPALTERAPDMPVLFAGSLGSFRFNRRAGSRSGLQMKHGDAANPRPGAAPDAVAPGSTAAASAMLARPSARGAARSFSLDAAFLSHPRYDDGGVFAGLEGVLYTTNRPLYSQVVASRGFLDLDGSVTGKPNTFVGDHATALNTEQLLGPSVQQPGWNIFVGYRFQGGVVVELDWLHLVSGTYTATASLIPPGFNNGAQFQNTFLFSGVNNFSTFWLGPPQKFPQGDAGATPGIWNGASYESIQFIQRFDMYQLNARIPIWETADARTYGLFGPRIAWVWDQFRWTTVATDQFGNSGPEFTALYTNTVSNRLYGIHCGWGGDWWLGSTPIGGFAFTFEAEAALYPRTWSRRRTPTTLWATARSAPGRYGAPAPRSRPAWKPASACGTIRGKPSPSTSATT